MKEKDVIDIEEKESWHKGPIRWIISIFLVLIIIMWIIPMKAIKLDPSPNYIPSYGEIVDFEINFNEPFSNSITLGLIDGKDSSIKKVADRIVVKACSNKGEICHAKAIYYFVRDNFVYVNDPNEFEYVKPAKLSLFSSGGDCDDSSVLVASLLDAVGIKTRFVFITNHVFVQANLPKALNRYKVESDWVNLDATCKNCEFGEVSYQTSKMHKRYLG
jgi:Transglutaminase-like superfamily